MATSVTLKPNAIDISGSTSGTTTLQASAVAGTTTLTLPAATDTLVGKATTDTLTNKTLTTPSVSSPTISDGTANGVAYLNGSKVLTTGSALVFDGSNLGVGVTPSAWAATNPIKAIQVGRGGSISYGNDSASTNIVAGAYLSATGQWTKIGTIASAKLALSDYDGSFVWSRAASGSGNFTYTDVMTLDASGNLGVGTTSPAERLHVVGKIAVSGTNPSIRQTVQNAFLDLCGGTTVGTDPSIQIAGSTTTSDANKVFYNSNTHVFRSSSGGTTYATIDASGNWSYGSWGLVVQDLAQLSIGSGDVGLLYISNSGQKRIIPRKPNAIGSASDNLIDLGDSGSRFKQIYAGTGTINTSDENEKQDIQDLSDAEKRVAVRIKSLIKTFRFNDAVAEKGDAARIHTGVIAQEVRDAFTSEGLDAHRYALFCSDTWVDAETNAEITRLGIRYDELLSFVISAI